MPIESDIKRLAINADKVLRKYTALAQENALKIYAAKKNETTATLNCEFFSMLKLDFPLYFSDPESTNSAATIESFAITKILRVYDDILSGTIVKQNRNPIQHNDSGVLVPLLDVCNAMPVSELRGITAKSKKRISIKSMFFEIKNKVIHIKSIQKSLDRYASALGDTLTQKSYLIPSSKLAMFEVGESQYRINWIIKNIICRSMSIVDNSPLFFELLNKGFIRPDDDLQASNIYDSALTPLLYRAASSSGSAEKSKYDFVKLDGDLSVRAIIEVSQNSPSIFIADRMSCDDTIYSERAWTENAFPVIAMYHISNRKLNGDYSDIYVYL